VIVGVKMDRNPYQITISKRKSAFKIGFKVQGYTLDNPRPN
jgi:hypothetical protein